MFNPRTDRLPDKDPPKPAPKPAIYDPPLPAGKPMGSGVRSGLSPQPTVAKEASPLAPSDEGPAPAIAAPSVATSAVPAAPSSDPGGSKLFIGVNIKLKGVEISDCDVLVIEGQVEATVNSKVMQIDQPGTLTGTALIDVAEVRGEFSGELTARGRLIVHGTGRVSGTIRYGKLIVEEGGEIVGDVKRIDGTEAQRSLLPREPRRQGAHGEASPGPAGAAYPGAARTYSS